jgi:carboxypeptidase T
MHDPTRLPRLRSLLGAGALSATLLASLAPLPAAAADFPARDSLYHNYTEMVADIMAVQTAHPDLVQVFSIGKSYENRDIWVAKISDNVAVDEAEPEILIDALHHAREHLTVEQALYTIHMLADDYADPVVKAIVDNREVFIVFEINPDGGEFDLTCTASTNVHAPYCAWRKTRQPNPGSTYKGTDPNRNYGYHWACCGGSSGSPSSITYHGSAAWSSKEVRVFRDFVNSRVINGRQQITAHLTLHTNGQLILWPYGYTKTDIPYDMTVTDHRAFVAMGKAMAARNGYVAKQSSDLYITDGDQIDWLYGVHRIFSFTWELFPKETPTVWGDHYPADENIAPQTARNRTALQYLMEVGGCAYRAIGLTKTNCGPLYDDLEISRGWRGDPFGTDTATKGRWQIANPTAVSLGGVATQLGTTTSGSKALVTGAAYGGSAAANDLDGGTTTARSAPVTLAATTGDLTFNFYFAHRADSTTSDSFRVYVEDALGTKTLVYLRAGSAAVVGAHWTAKRIPLTPWAGQTIRLIFTASDVGRASLVEAGVDDIRIERP